MYINDLNYITEEIVRDDNNYPLTFRKVGKVVTCETDTWFDITKLTVPSNFLPKTSFQTSGCCCDSGWRQYLANISISINGKIIVYALKTYASTEYTNLTTGKVRFNTSWISD